MLLCTQVRLFGEHPGTDSIFFLVPVLYDVSGVILNNPLIN